MNTAERWSRGVSTLGFSGHNNEYRSGVLINNFNEDISGEHLKASGKHLLGYGAPFAANSTQRAHYNSYGKIGAELIAASERQDQRLSTLGQGADMLTRHGKFEHPQQSYYATVNQLTYGEDRQHGEPRVDTYLWAAGNTHNRTVPLNTMTSSLTATRRAQWAAEANQDAFATTTRAGTMSAALESAMGPTKTGTLKPPTDGEGCTVGRKPVGVHADECNKTYRRTGLRDVYYPGNVA